MDIISNQHEKNISYNSSKTPLQKVGAFIKEARVGRSISIEDLAKSLRIGEEQISALENGQEDLLPEKVFIKAMVRRISEKLNIETEFILEELKGRKVSINNIYNKNAETKKEIEKIKLTPLIIILSGILGLTSSIILTKYIEKSNQSPDSKKEISNSFTQEKNMSKNNMYYI